MMKKKASVGLTVDNYMKMPYTIELTPDDDLGWFASIQEFPGCMSDGESPEVAVSNLRETQREWIAAALEDMGAIPLPKTTQEYSGRFLVRTTSLLHRRLTEVADEEGVSTNQLCTTLLAEGLVSKATQKQMENIGAKVDHMSKYLDAITSTMSVWRLPSPNPGKIVSMSLGDHRSAQDSWIMEDKRVDA